MLAPPHVRPSADQDVAAVLVELLQPGTWIAPAQARWLPVIEALLEAFLRHFDVFRFRARTSEGNAIGFKTVRAKPCARTRCCAFKTRPRYSCGWLKIAQRSWIRCILDFPNPFFTPIRMPGTSWCKRRNMPRPRSCFWTGARRAGSPHRSATRSSPSVFTASPATRHRHRSWRGYSRVIGSPSGFRCLRALTIHCTPRSRPCSNWLSRAIQCRSTFSSCAKPS
jgi:hypothetical protein